MGVGVGTVAGECTRAATAEGSARGVSCCGILHRVEEAEACVWKRRKPVCANQTNQAASAVHLSHHSNLSPISRSVEI